MIYRSVSSYVPASVGSHPNGHSFRPSAIISCGIGFIFVPIAGAACMLGLRDNEAILSKYLSSEYSSIRIFESEIVKS